MLRESNARTKLIFQIEYMVTNVIRIYPEGLPYEGLVCSRMEIIGCDPKGDLKIL